MRLTTDEIRDNPGKQQNSELNYLDDYLRYREIVSPEIVTEIKYE